MREPNVPIGPVVGAPPSLEWVSVGSLNVDPAYQRATESKQSRKVINGMVARWEWSLCQPLVVSRRDDGNLYVLDGQHRWTGALERGDILHLPCVVLSGKSLADEAGAFVALNTKRQRLGQGDIFNAALASGDPTAKRAFALIEECGLSLARHTNWTSWKPGQVFCAPAIQKAVVSYGEEVVGKALRALLAAYPDAPLRFAGTLLPALYAVFKGRARMGGFDERRFIETLAALDQEEWKVEGWAIQGQSGCSRTEALVQAMMREYDALVSERQAA